MREVPANFDKYSWGNICELLAEYLSFVWKIFVAESDLRSACKSGSLVTGYLQMIKGSRQCQPFEDVLLAGGCADCTHCVHTLDCYRAPPDQMKLRKFTVNLQISWEHLIFEDFDENVKWKTRGEGCQKVFFPFPGNLNWTFWPVPLPPECRRSFGPIWLFALNLSPCVQWTNAPWVLCGRSLYKSDQM